MVVLRAFVLGGVIGLKKFREQSSRQESIFRAGQAALRAGFPALAYL